MTANVNVTKVLFKRGNTSQNAAYTGINGEVTVDTQAKTLRIHDGVTAGGNVITAASEVGSYSNTNVAAYLAAFDGNILPAANITYSLGSEQFQWRDLWISNNTIYIGNIPIRVDGGTLLVDGAPVSLGFDQDLNTTDSVNFANIGTSTGQISVPTDTSFAVRLNHSTHGEANVIVDSQGYMTVTGGYTGTSFTQVYTGEGAIGYFGFSGNVTDITGINGLILDTGIEGSGGSWRFDTNGDLGFPGSEGTNYVIGEGEGGLYISSSHNLVLVTDEGTTDQQFVFNTGGTFQVGATEITDGYVSTTPGNSLFIVSGAGLEISANAGAVSWSLGQDGSFELPGNLIFSDSSVQTTAWTGSVDFGNTIAIGYNTGTVSQGSKAVAVGSTAGNVSQGTGAVAVGDRSGVTSQGNLSVAVGSQAGEQIQGIQATAVGSGAGNYNQGAGTVAIGTNAGAFNQGLRATAIGSLAGASGQGEYAVAIGNFAGGTNQANNSIIINATGSPLDQTTANTFTVAPIRNTGGTHGVLQYNNSTKEVSYSSTLVGNLSVTGNITQQSAYYETYSNVTNSGGNLTCNFSNGATFYTTLDANVTVNFTNVVATAGQVTGATLIVDQGATAYSVANIQINSGGVQTVKWAGGTTNTGTASNTDIMSFSLISLDGTNWRILGQIANYA